MSLGFGNAQIATKASMLAHTRQKMISLLRVDENRTEQCFAAHVVQCCP
jgi:hypothetical protein